MTVETGVRGVLDHLMFHKAIIHEEGRSDRIESYLDVLRSMEENLSSRDPFDRSIEMVFNLVLTQGMDPWEIDLMEFSRLYAQRMEGQEVDFIVAGKLLFMAWFILKCQSERVLRSQEEAECGSPFFADWDFDSMDLFWERERPEAHFDDFDPDGLELNEVVRHHTLRPVMLVELLDAFDEARREARVNLKAATNRRASEVFDEKAHMERLEQDVEEIWERIQRCGGGPIAIEDLCGGGKEDMITVLVSLLFLTKMGKIALWQDDLPEGQIFLEVRMAWDIGTLEDAAEESVKLMDGETVM